MIDNESTVTGLKYFRLKSNYRQIHVAKLTGIHASRLSRIEGGWQEPRRHELNKLADLYNVNVIELLKPMKLFQDA